jgi:hypothetical protein
MMAGDSRRENGWWSREARAVVWCGFCGVYVSASVCVLSVFVSARVCFYTICFAVKQGPSCPKQGSS